MGKARLSSLKVLLALSAVVLLVHLALLTDAPLSLSMRQPQPVKAFVTRPVVANSPPAVRDKPKPPARVAKPKPKPMATPKTDVAPTEPMSALPASPASDVLPDVAAPPPVAETLAQPDELASAPRPPREPALKVNAISLPASVRMQYQVEANKFPFSARAELVWKQDGTGYDARLELSAFGLTRLQTSRGQVTGEGLAPTRFSDKYRSEVAAHFNREQGKVTFSANTPEVPLLSGAQDRLSVLLQLAAMIAGDPAHFPSATTVTLQVVGPRAADLWLFTVGEEETLVLPGGEQRTLKLVRNPREAYDQKVELWLGVNLGYLPVRIKITESNGDFIDQKLVGLEAKP